MTSVACNFRIFISAFKVIYRVYSEEFANCMQCRSGYAIPLVILKFKLKTGDEVKMFFFKHPWSWCSAKPIQPYHFQVDIIWCTGIPFNTSYLHA